MADIYVKSGGGSIGSGSYRGIWGPSKTYASGDRVCGNTQITYWTYECTTPGTSGGSEPAWVNTDGSTTSDNGVTWTTRTPNTWINATQTLLRAAANDAAGDIIYVSNSYAESTTSSHVLIFAGVYTSPVKILCVNDSQNNPTLLANTGSLVTVGQTTLKLRGSCYFYGLTFDCAYNQNASASSLDLNDSADQVYQIYDNCSLRSTSLNSVGRPITLGQAGFQFENSIKLLNCTFKFGHTAGCFSVGTTYAEINGGGFVSDTAKIATIFKSMSNIVYVNVINFDMSILNSSLNLIESSVPAGGFIKFINCNLPSGWSGGVVAGAPSNPKFRASIYNCNSGATNYKLWIETYAGSIKSESGIIKFNGASDTISAYSWKMTTTANANKITASLITDDMTVWIDAVGSLRTITVDILHNSTTALNNDEIWLELDYMNTSGSSLGILVSNKPETILSANSAHSSSTSSWNTDILGTPYKQKLSITFTPQNKGLIYARVCLAKPSYTVYIDPKPIISI